MDNNLLPAANSGLADLALLGDDPMSTTFDLGPGNDVGPPISKAPKTIALLDKDQKAAIILRLLMDDAEDGTLDFLSERQQARIVRAMERLSSVDEETMLQVVDEFLTELGSSTLYFGKDLDGVVERLGDHLNENIAQNLSQLGKQARQGDPWEDILALETTAISSLLENESPQVCAITLSFLKPDQAAEILSLLPAEKAKETTIAALQDRYISDETVFEIGTALYNAALATQDQGALSGDPASRVGEIFNFTPSAAREVLLTDLAKQSPELAARVRKEMFTFADIPDRIEIKDVPKVARGVNKKLLLTALVAGGDVAQASVDFILGNISKRLAEQTREEMVELGALSSDEADQSLNEVIQAIRTLADNGEITLISPVD